MNIIPFNFKDHNIRVIIDENGGPLFVLADICKILELSNPTKVKNRLDDDEVQVIDLSALKQIQGNKNSDLVNVVNESGLYSSIIRSDKPEAKVFKKWITSKVLPSIRKTGSYSIKPMSLEEMTLQVIEGQQNKILQLENKIEADKPLTAFGKAVSQSVGTCLVGDWIKAINDSGDIKMGRTKAFRWLRENKYLMKNNRPYQKHIDSGLFDVKESLIATGASTFTTFTALLTGKGQMVLAEKLKAAMEVA